MPKLCIYCHYRPCAPNSSYCCRKHETAKHDAQERHRIKNRDNMKLKRAERREAERIAREKEARKMRRILKEARRLLREEDNAPHRLRLEQKVRMWNIVTDKIEEKNL